MAHDGTKITADELSQPGNICCSSVEINWSWHNSYTSCDTLTPVQ